MFMHALYPIVDGNVSLIERTSVYSDQIIILAVRLSKLKITCRDSRIRLYDNMDSLYFGELDKHITYCRTV